MLNYIGYNDNDTSWQIIKFKISSKIISFLLKKGLYLNKVLTIHFPEIHSTPLIKIDYRQNDVETHHRIAGTCYRFQRRYLAPEHSFTTRMLRINISDFFRFNFELFFPATDSPLLPAQETPRPSSALFCPMWYISEDYFRQCFRSRENSFWQ